MLKQFRTYQLALEFYRRCQEFKAPGFLKNQLVRAAGSVALNLSEGTAKPTVKERQRIYGIALASLRECQAALELNGTNVPAVLDLADHLGASIYRLIHPGPQSSV